MVIRTAPLLCSFSLVFTAIACQPLSDAEDVDAGDTMNDLNSETASESNSESVDDTEFESTSEIDTETVTDTGFETDVDTSCDGVVQIPDPYFEQVLRYIINKPDGELTGEDLLTVNNLTIDPCDMGNLAQKKQVNLIGAQCLRSLQEFNGFCLEIDDLHWLADLPTLRSFSLFHSIYPESELATITQLGSLIFNNTPIHLDSVSGMSNLGNLTLFSSTGESNLSPLAGLKDLTTLDLTGCGSPDEDLDFSSLGGLTKLVTLNLWASAAVDLPPSSALTNLVNLDITNTLVSDLTPLSVATKLKILNAKLSQVHTLSQLQNCVALESIDATETGLEDIEGLANKPNLKVLELPSNNISDLTPFVEIDATNLEILDLGINQITDLSPLVENETFGMGAELHIRVNPFDCVEQAANLQALMERGIDVYCECEGCIYGKSLSE